VQSIRLGDHGPAVIDVRVALQALALIPSGEAALSLSDPHAAVFDGACALAVRQFQQSRGLPATGEVDEDTYRQLSEARYSLGDRLLFYTPGRMLRGDDVVALQQRLLELGFDLGNADGIFGPDTASGLAAFQRDCGLRPDATCGPQTIRALERLGPKVVGGSAIRLRSQVHRLASGPALVGKRIVIDTADARPDTVDPARAAGSNDVVADLCARIEGRLSVMGADTILTRDPDRTRSPAQRAAIANDAGADLFISLDVNWDRNPHARGLATFFYGTSNSVSHVGEEFAALLHRELCARTDVIDLATHPQSSELLRLTTMPAVRVELGYLTNGADRTLLGDPAVRDTLAEGALAAIQRFYLIADDDVPTGTWHFPPELYDSLPS